MLLRKDRRRRPTKRRLRDTPGTIANVKFQRSMPWAPPVEYAVGVQRQGMRVDAVEFQQLSDVAGCIHIISFNGPDVIAPVQRALQQMERLGLFVLVVDLRENCGGRLRDALKIAEMLRAAAFLKDPEVSLNQTAHGPSDLGFLQRRAWLSRCPHGRPLLLSCL